MHYKSGGPERPNRIVGELAAKKLCRHCYFFDILFVFFLELKSYIFVYLDKLTFWVIVKSMVTDLVEELYLSRRVCKHIDSTVR